MKPDFKADRLDVAAFACEGASLAGSERLARFPRLASEASEPVPERPVHWSAEGELRASGGRADDPWLHLSANATLPQACQRCLEPVEIRLEVDRWFRFAADEETAASQDEDAEEDVLALEAGFDLCRLVEDELLMALPVVPLHDACPVPVGAALADPDFQSASEDRKNPFAALAQLRPRTKG